MKFSEPTPIQEEAIPHAMKGKDILGSAQTGTGKTAAFGIPLIARLMSNPKGSALVMTPTRELATQVLTQLRLMLGKSRDIKTALLIGGDSMSKQIRQIRDRPRIIVGTPGRINDHLDRGILKLKHADFLVLDETDRMLDAGFTVQIEKVMTFLAPQRQTLLFSATVAPNIARIAEKYLNDPVRVSVSKSSTPAPNIKQDTIKVSDGEKYTSLLTSLDERDGSIIVFVKTKRGTEKMAKRLQKEGHSAEAIHGDLKQSKRDRVIASFRKMKYRILVATDVAARGLDIPHIEHVINYDLPQCAEDYVHRIGRTARAGATGSALSFITPADRGKWGAIDRLLNPNSKKESRSRKPSSRKPSRKRPSNAAPKGDVVQLRRDKKKKWSTSKSKKAA
ncbi:MAG: DEAD/DEAH box helicase [Betaproteobacteria bacterium]|nr:DEAD/DEAH box helicase [Betaproteobacteria bacterium]MBT6185127.1 DEAD/DEAH box helicase [Betaproteobacteria bacterium]MBT6529973.1 DEAD/DEAH box helicase [Betaproteobacteria bacterium]MBT7427437.1 DEAD/DEAH box helicase [Betaproteobacteria bacterium]